MSSDGKEVGLSGRLLMAFAIASDAASQPTVKPRVNSDSAMMAPFHVLAHNHQTAKRFPSNLEPNTEAVLVTRMTR
jgi:hypothetical protein